MNPEDLKVHLVPIGYFLVIAGLIYYLIPSPEAFVPPKREALVLGVYETPRDFDAMEDFLNVFESGSREVAQVADSKLLQDIEDLELGEDGKTVEQQGQPQFQVSGIFIDGRSNLAYIDGNLRKEGEKFDGVTLERILPDQVTLRSVNATLVRKVMMPPVVTMD